MTNWRNDGVAVIPADSFDSNTPQTPGMLRSAAVTAARTGATGLWTGTVTIAPGALTGAHHHGPVETVIYVVRGLARMRWGEQLQYASEAGPGDFIWVPPYVPHQEINADPAAELHCVIARTGQDPIVVNLDLTGVAEPETVRWVDPTHRA